MGLKLISRTLLVNIIYHHINAIWYYYYHWQSYWWISWQIQAL